MSYGQYCGLARALDVIGDRWTLLIIRELLAGRARYRELRVGLPGIATNLLADRLRRLEADGLVTRAGLDYVLTPRGSELRGVIRELIRWSEPLMADGPADDHFDGRWLIVALEALLQPTGEGRVDVRAGGAVVHVVVDKRGVTVGPGPAVGAEAVIDAEGQFLLGIATGRLPLREAIKRGLANVEGDVAVASSVLDRVHD